MNLTYVRELSRDQVVQALTESHALWGSSQTLESRLGSTLKRLTEAGPGMFRMSGLVDPDGRVAASLKLYGLELDAPSGPVATAGLGAVFTAESRRRQGLAERLIKTVLAERYASGVGAAWLFSDIAPAYYAKQGFKAFPAVTSSFETARLPKDEPFETRAAGPSEREPLRAWYEADAPAGTLRPLRSPAVWEFFRNLNGTGPDLVLSRGGVEVGYLSVCPSGDKLWVEEWAAPGEDEARVWATVRALAEEKGLSAVGSWLPPWRSARGAVRSQRTRSIPMLAAAPGMEALLEHPAAGTHFGSLDHF